MLDQHLLLVVGGFAACTLLQEAARKYHVTLLMAARAAVATVKRTVLRAFEDTYDDSFDDLDDQADATSSSDQVNQNLDHLPHALVLSKPCVPQIMVPQASTLQPLLCIHPQPRALQIRLNIAAGALAPYVIHNTALYWPLGAVLSMGPSTPSSHLTGSNTSQRTAAGVIKDRTPSFAKSQLRSRVWLGAVGVVSAAAVLYGLHLLQSEQDARLDVANTSNTQAANEAQDPRHRLSNKKGADSRSSSVAPRLQQPRVPSTLTSTSHASATAGYSKTTAKPSSRSTYRQQRHNLQQDQLSGVLLRQQWILDRELTQLLQRKSAASGVQQSRNTNRADVGTLHLAAVEGFLQQLEDCDVQLAETLVNMSHM